MSAEVKERPGKPSTGKTTENVEKKIRELIDEDRR
jgi:hypothetical protein